MKFTPSGSRYELGDSGISYSVQVSVQKAFYTNRQIR